MCGLPPEERNRAPAVRVSVNVAPVLIEPSLAFRCETCCATPAGRPPGRKDTENDPAESVTL